MKTTTMTRKQFLGTVIGVCGTAVLYACGGDDGGGSDAASNRTCETNGTSVNISSNHGHVLTVSAADVTAGAAKTYDIMGTGDHTHSVTISAGNFTSLKNGQSVNVTSTSGNAHTHTILVMCA